VSCAKQCAGDIPCIWRTLPARDVTLYHCEGRPVYAKEKDVELKPLKASSESTSSTVAPEASSTTQEPDAPNIPDTPAALPEEATDTRYDNLKKVLVAGATGGVGR
jgi:hypothetical protein